MERHSEHSSVPEPTRAPETPSENPLEDVVEDWGSEGGDNAAPKRMPERESDEARKERRRKRHEAEKELWERNRALAEGMVKDLGYEPFGGDKAVWGLLKLTDQEKALPVRRRRELKAERLEKFKFDLRAHQDAAAKLVGRLRAEVFAHPDVTEDEMTAIIKEGAVEARLRAAELKFFLVGAERYRRLHQAVEKYRAMYVDDKELAEACFGVELSGTVQVEKGPSSLLFRVFDEDDYARLYLGEKYAAGASDHERSSVEGSGGFAISGAAIEELRGTLMVEKMHSEPLYFGPDVEKRIPMRTRGVVALWGTYNGPADLVVEGEGTWRFTHDEGAERLWKVERVDAGKTETVATLVQGISSGSFFDLQYNAPASLEVDLIGDGGESVGTFRFNEDSLDVALFKERDVELVFRKVASKEKYHPRIRRHEEQHLFDRIMEVCNRFSDYDILRGVALAVARDEAGIAGTEDPKLAVLRSLARRERAITFDRMARSEFLAYYRDGHGFDYARESLLNQDGIYAYENDIDGGLEEVAEKVARNFEMFAPNLFPGETLTATEVLPQVLRVFRDDYRADIAKWAKAAEKVAEKLGFDTEAVIAALSTDSVNQWPRLSRQIRRNGPKPAKQDGAGTDGE